MRGALAGARVGLGRETVCAQAHAYVGEWVGREGGRDKEKEAESERGRKLGREGEREATVALFPLQFPKP
jgi:hypothetical protein